MLREIFQANLYLGVFQETKVTDRVHMRELLGYCVLAADTTISHCRVFAVFYWDTSHFQV